MGSKFIAPILKEFLAGYYKDARADLYACFIQRNLRFCKADWVCGYDYDSELDVFVFLQGSAILVIRNHIQSTHLSTTAEGYLAQTLALAASLFVTMGFQHFEACIESYLISREASRLMTTLTRFFKPKKFTATSEDFKNLPEKRLLIGLAKVSYVLSPQRVS